MKLEAEKRTAGNAGELRRKGRIPGVIYNRELNVSVHIEARAFDRVFREQGTSSLIDLDIAGDETHPVLVKAVQMDKRRRVAMHVDFYAITAGQVVDVNVPIDFVGIATGVKDQGGLLDIQRRELFISVLPNEIPNEIQVDISHLSIGDSIHVGDIAHLLPDEAEILDDADRTLITVVAPRVLEEELEVEEDLEPELIGQEGDDEGDEGDGGDEDDEG